MRYHSIVIALTACLVSCSTAQQRGPELQTGAEQTGQVERASRKAEEEKKTGVIYASSGQTEVGGEPEAAGKPVPKPVVVVPAPTPIKIDVDPKGAYSHKGESTDLTLLKPIFVKAAADDTPLVVLAAKGVNKVQLSALIELARESGVRELSIKSQVGEALPPMPPQEPAQK